MIGRIRSRLARSLVLCATLAVPPACLAEVKGVFDAAARARQVARLDTAFSCPEPQPAVRDIRIAEYYTDKAYTRADEGRRKAADLAAAPLHAYAKKVTYLADRALVQREGRGAVAECLVRWLHAWARNDAMLGDIEGPLAEHYRKWTIVSIALAYAAIKPLAAIEAGRAARIDAWLRRLTGEMERYYGQWRRESWNNHVYWQGLAEAAVAAAVNDRALLDKGLEKYRHGVAEITPEGLLPKEVARKRKALGYHAFSLAPLVLLAEIGERNGIALYALRDGAIHRLAGVVAEGVADTSRFEAIVGEPQDLDKGRDPLSVAWLEPYLARFPNDALARLLRRYRPVGHEWLGGNLTLHFAEVGAARSVTPVDPR